MISGGYYEDCSDSAFGKPGLCLLRTLGRLFSTTASGSNPNASSTGGSAQPAGDPTHGANPADSATSTHAAHAGNATHRAWGSIAAGSWSSSIDSNPARADADKFSANAASPSGASSARAAKSNAVFTRAAHFSNAIFTRAAYFSNATNSSGTTHKRRTWASIATSGAKRGQIAVSLVLAHLVCDL